MTLSSFRAAPRRGHLERVKRIYGYLSKMRNAVIRVRTDEPDFSGLPTAEYDWKNTVYGICKKLLKKISHHQKLNFSLCSIMLMLILCIAF